MKYSRFELLALSVGSVSVVGGVLGKLRGGLSIEEIVAQALMLIVLVGAVHWGRKGGMVTALVAVVAYVAMRTPLLVREGFSADVVGLVLVRTLTYGVVGIAGGELCSRVRYVLARLDSTSNIDESTGLFNERFIAGVVRSMVGRYERYREPFSVVILSLGEFSKPGLHPVQDRALLRAVAKQIRGDLRLVDDVGRLDDGRFLLVLPHTDKPGARIAADRVSQGVGHLLGERNPLGERLLLGERGDSVRAEILGAEDDLLAITDLCGDAPAPDVRPTATPDVPKDRRRAA